MNTREKPTLYGDRVMLRPLGKDDAKAMYAMTQDREGNRLTGTQATFTEEQVRQWCESVAEQEGRVDCAIVSRETREFLGEVVFNQIDEANRSANFRIALCGPHHFNKGYGTEAAQLMLTYGFEVLGLHRISLEVFAFNPRAIRVYEKLRFRREGVLREVLFMDGAYHDAVVMSLLRREYLGTLNKVAEQGVAGV